MTYTSLYNPRNTPQSQPIPGRKDMMQNNAGGYAFGIDKWAQLQRFLILGSDKPTYYASAQKMTADNADVVIECVREAGIRTVNEIVDVSVKGRAPKNDPALFALALAIKHGDVATKAYAYRAIPQVARTGTHILQLAEMLDKLKGWSAGMRNAFSKWYTEKSVPDVLYQVVKYRQRGGWSHRDILRLSHPKVDGSLDNLFYWIVKGELKTHGDSELTNLERFLQLQSAETERAVLDLLATDSAQNRPFLTWEMIPTQFLGSRDVWSALLHKGLPMTALLRNLARMTANGTVAQGTAEARLVANQLTDTEHLVKARIHPLSVLVAMRTYAQGHGDKGSLVWNPVTAVVDALDKAFYASFGSVEQTDEQYLLALDISGSMGWNNIAGMPITPREASAAMAMVTMSANPSALVMGFSHELVPLDISPRRRLDDNIRAIERIPMGGTNCALPMMYATKQGLHIDKFVAYTDNETWQSRPHPVQALDEYQRKYNKSAKLVVVGMTATGFSIADPTRSDNLDVVGFDLAAPNIIAQF
ncbi:MAG: TROVE domain-containing protein [Sphaerochaeta sp.]|nr:TROVE domain-containing protein [Sphaerochaeta sp.]